MRVLKKRRFKVSGGRLIGALGRSRSPRSFRHPLDLSRLMEVTPAITKEVVDYMIQGAAVSLADGNHAPGVMLKWTGIRPSTRPLFWAAPPHPAVAQSSWDKDEAAEQGACAVGIAAACRATNLVVVGRAVKGTRFDYWLGKPGGMGLFQGCSQLEISGIAAQSAAALAGRVRSKQKQIASSPYLSDGYVAVVKFDLPQVHLDRP